MRVHLGRKDPHFCEQEQLFLTLFVFGLRLAHRSSDSNGKRSSNDSNGKRASSDREKDNKERSSGDDVNARQCTWLAA